jgi:uncharacterized heparinase superfamily protein
MHKTASKMLSWLKNLSFSTGIIPFLNDSSGDIAPDSSEIFKYAERLGIKYTSISLSDCNYRMFKNNLYTFICDIGGISPSYQCGHAHADTFNFVMELNNRLLFVDTGCSSYEIGETRMFERGTSAHNTVVVNYKNSSQVWAGHRVGKRSQVKILEDTPHKITARHNGFKNVIHIRTFIQNIDNIEIIDNICGKNNNLQNVAYFHLDNSIKNVNIDKNTITVVGIKLLFLNFSDLYITEYEQAVGFNKRIKAYCICVNFENTLTAKILF